MARAQRTAELLAAAGLVDLDIERERQKGLRSAASSQALASLLPSLIKTGAGIAGDAAEYDLKKQAVDADTVAAKAKETDALDRIANRKAKSAADIAKAEADRAAAAEKVAREGRKDAREDAVAQTRAGMAGGLSRADLERQASAVGMTPEQLLQDADLANVAERNAAAKAAKAAAPKPGPSPASQARQAKKDELLDLQIAAAKGKPAEQAKKDAKLTSGEATAAIELKGAQKLLTDLGNLKKSGGKDGAPINTGPLEALIGFAAGKVGLQSPEWAKFRATAGSQLAEYIKSISGGAVSEPERASLLQNVPTLDDDDEEFIAKLEAVQGILNTKLANMRAGYAATGRDTAIFDDVEAETDAAELSEEDLDAEIARLKGNR